MTVMLFTQTKIFFILRMVNEMTIQEKFKDNNLFDVINKIQTLPFSNLEGVNNYWLAIYGVRCILPNIQDMSINNIAMMVHSLYSTKWDRMYNYYLEDVLENGNKSETTTKNITDTLENTNTITGEEIHKVSAFDSDSMSDDNSNSENKTTKDNTKNDRQETIVINGKNGNYTNDFITYYNYLTKTPFFDIIYEDVNKVVSTGTITLDV